MPQPDGAPTVGAVLWGLARHPVDRLWRRWNWKSAVASAAIRAAIFYAANRSAGARAAWLAAVAELLFRATTSGFYGTITEAFVPVRPRARAMAASLVVLPVLAHSLEFVLHWLRGTPELARSLIASASFTVVSTSFNLFAMRRGALIVGEGRQSLLTDLRRLPMLIAAFTWAIVDVRRWLVRRPRCL